MTLEQVIELARELNRDGNPPNARDTYKVLDWILNNLGEDVCGYERPIVMGKNSVEVPNWCSGGRDESHATPADVRGMARMLLVAADRAEGGQTDPWTVSSFNENTLRGIVERGGVMYKFHSTSFRSDTAFRWPRVGEEVEVAFNASGQLLSVHGK